MPSPEPYLSGNLAIESLAATLMLVSRRSSLADIPSAALSHAIRRGWLSADGQPTVEALSVCADLLRAGATDGRSAPADAGGIGANGERR